MGNQVRILLLEDDPNLGLIVEESLVKAGFTVCLVRDGLAGLEAFESATFNLCLVDVMMPLMDGFSFARQIRVKKPDVPLIFLTARSLIKDKTEGFNIGCDDYLTKPFSMEELLLRIEAVLRRSGRSLETARLPEKVALGSCIYHSRERSLQNRGELRKLTDKEADLLELLYRHRNQTLERSKALISIWGDDSYHCGRSMDVFVSRLRKYLDDDPDVEIRTVHGQGLQLLIPGAQNSL
jgi:DNA-binding response OmpR family regulator